MRLHVVSETKATVELRHHTIFLEETEEIEIVYGPEQMRPLNRVQCAEGARPCPWVSCRYNLYLDVRGDGVLRVNFPNLEPDEMVASCALDMAEDGPRTLDQVAALMGMSKERARQLEASAMVKLRDALGAREYDDLENG